MNFDIEALLNEIKVLYQSSEKSYSTSSLFKKSISQAIHYRKLGNNWYKAGLDHEALNFYTQSIAFALDGSEELSLAYANRSAALLRVRKYELCLLDMNRALKGNYPEHLKTKLDDRKRKCLADMSENKVKTDVTTNRQNGNDMLPPTTSKKMEIRDIEFDPAHLIDVVPRIGDFHLENSSSLYTTRKVELEFDEERGNYMIASTDIEPGEILSMDNFFSSISIVEQEYENCSYCFLKFPAMIPCRSCTREVYCGEQCRKLAFNSYHRIECEIWSLCLNEKLNTYELLSLRSFLIGTDQGVRLGTLAKTINFNVFKEKIDFSTEAHIDDYLSILRSHRYKTLHKPHKEMILKAVKVISVLKRELFFGQAINEDMKSNTLNETELCATLLLIINFAVTELNNFVISEVTSLNNSVCNESVLGFAVCPLHNVVYHSCDPNAGDFVRGRKHVLFALRPIKRGEQISLSHGVSFSKNSIAERVKKLSTYDFTCHCEACTHKWPLLKELRGRRPKFLTRNKKVIEDIRKMNEVVFCEETQISETLTNAIQFRKMLYGNVKPPSLMILLCEALILGIMKSYGNFYSEYSKKL